MNISTKDPGKGNQTAAYLGEGNTRKVFCIAIHLVRQPNTGSRALLEGVAPSFTKKAHATCTCKRT